MLTITPGMFPGFHGLFYRQNEDGYHEYFYHIHNSLYYTINTDQFNVVESDNNILMESRRFPAFNIDLNGSYILAIVLDIELMLYQKDSDGQFRKLLRSPEISGEDDDIFRNIEVDIINVPDRDGHSLPLTPLKLAGDIHSIIESLMPDNHNDILRILNNMDNSRVLESVNPLFEQSCTALVSRLYGLEIKLPEYLILNGLKVNFISFQQISDMLSQGQIERYVIDSSLQPWAGTIGTEYRIFTFFAKYGMTYLVKARYDQATNQIYL